MPALVIYQILDCEPPFSPTADRAVIEELAQTCMKHRPADLDSLVVETRYNVVRSNLPHEVAAIRRLRDYLPSGLAATSCGEPISRRTRPPRRRRAAAELVIGP